MRPLSNDAGRALVRGILNFINFDTVVEEISSRDWASVTFTGARHELALRLDGESAAEAADRLCENLEAAEFHLRGHILADIALMAREATPDGGVRLRLEALTVEDA